MARSTHRPIRTIDHEPLDQTASHANAPIFGKRQSKSTLAESKNTSHQNADGISQYFINRVKSRQSHSDHHGDEPLGTPFASSLKPSRSAIRDTDTIDLDDIQTPIKIPYTTLAAAALLAFALPLGFIYFTEIFANSNIDTMTTASISAADGLEVREVSMTKLLKNGTFVVTINGRIANRSGDPKSLLPLTISLRDEDGREVQSWRHRLGKNSLKENSTLHFMTSAIDFSGKAKTAHVLAQTATAKR